MTAGTGERERTSNRGLHHPLQWLRWIGSNGRRLAVLLVGLAFLGAGLAMLVLPGPGLLVAVAGLAVLATEFAWAERMLDRTRERAARASAPLATSRAARALFATSALSLLTGGAAVVALADGYRAAGASALVAGLCALSILVPRVHRWLAPPPAAGDEPPDPRIDPQKGTHA